MKIAYNSVPKLQFPILARDKELFILFTDKCKGIVLSAPPDSPYGVGDYCNDWIPVTDRDSWTILPPGDSVTLSNG